MRRSRPIAACVVLGVLSCAAVAEDLPAAPAPEVEVTAAAADATRPATTAVASPAGSRSLRASSRFNVRLARVGSGFEAGTSGMLRISEAGLDFIPKGQARVGWTVRWRDLAAARADEDGFWDALYPPVLLVERGGRKHYLARIDAQGRHLPADPVLASIAEARRQHELAKKSEPIKPPEPR